MSVVTVLQQTPWRQDRETFRPYMVWNTLVPTRIYKYICIVLYIVIRAQILTVLHQASSWWCFRRYNFSFRNMYTTVSLVEVVHFVQASMRTFYIFTVDSFQTYPSMKHQHKIYKGFLCLENDKPHPESVMEWLDDEYLAHHHHHHPPPTTTPTRPPLHPINVF